MGKRIISLLLALVMLHGIFLNSTFIANAATQLQTTPCPKVEYNYSTNVEVGTIRYIAQNKSSKHFNSKYWPTSSFGGYTGGPEIECGTACISMALSYVGVDRTPKVLLEKYNGYTGRMWVQQESATSKSIGISTTSISNAMDDYINGNGMYSPLLIYIVPFSSTSDMHWVLLVGKLSENKYLALNPWHSSGTDGTFTIKINGSSATYNGTTNPITDVKQWHNPNVKPPIVKDIYPAYCAIKVTSSTINVNSQPCEPTTDASSKTLEVASKGAQYQAIGLYKNKWGNLWYKVKLKESSGTGYMYAGNTTYLAHSINDIEPSGVTAPTTITQGKAWSLTGTVKSTYNELTGVSVYVYSGSNAQGAKVTGDSVSVSSNSYPLKGSTLDNKTEFDKLVVGTYTYIVSASYKYCYATSGKAYETKTDTIPIYQATFTVQKSTSCSHSYSSKVTTAATCGSNGVKTYTCSKCSSSYTETIPATGKHSYTSKVTTAETCTTAGVITYTCSKCSASYTEALDPAGHYYAPWDTVEEPGCTTAGRKERKCVSCLGVESEAIPPVGHSYKATVIGATCVDPKKTIYVCNMCGDYYTEYDTGDYTEWSVERPSGVDDSLIESRKEYRYQTKEYTTSSNSSMAGWTQYGSTSNWGEYGAWSEWSDTKATASDSTKVETRTVHKYYYYKCPSCGAHMHGWGLTCPTWAGGCGKGKIESGHYVQVWSTVAPNNVNWKDFHGTGKYYANIDGQRVFKHSNPESKLQYRYCTRTQETTYKFYRWSNWSDWTVTPVTENAETRVETRTMYRYLDVKLGDHQYTEVITEPTCQSEGYTTYTCSVCGDSYTDNYVGKQSHDYQAIVTEPTCVDDGYITNICTDCGDSYMLESIPALAHSYSYTVTQKPTESASGILTGTCTGCGETMTDTLPKLSEDDYTFIVEKKPTTTETGTAIYTWEEETYGTVTITVTLDKLAILYGDVNGDGEVSGKDRSILARYLAEWEGYTEDMIDMAAADVNQDGVVNGKDRSILARYLAEWIGYETLPYVG